MPSLIVLCPHCLTWIEIHADSCPECGGAVCVEDPDPSDELLAQRLGDPLVDLGPMLLARRGWPGQGQLLATSEGLLFVPRFTRRPNGALEALTEGFLNPSSRVANLFHWWSLPPWRRPISENESLPPVTPLKRGTPIEELMNSPGGLFVARQAIRRIIVRRGRIQVERQPSRSVTFSQMSGYTDPGDALKQLMDYSPWQQIISGI